MHYLLWAIKADKSRAVLLQTVKGSPLFMAAVVPSLPGSPSLISTAGLGHGTGAGCDVGNGG